MAEETLFTKIIKHEIPSNIIYEDDTVTAFTDINPKAQHHILIVPHKPIPSIAEVQPEDEQVLGHLLVVARKIATELGVNESGYRLVVNVGRDGGQEVPHLHVHLLAGGRLGGLGFPQA
ncbi:MAG: histidine triad nucleotide-binding protein [Succinivibrio sp.]|nr:histidine triad nucleotide-binding protein [Succinivibrio sp.]